VPAIVTILALLALATVAGSIRVAHRRRHSLPRPMALATAGGRAFAANVGTLSEFRPGLELPRLRNPRLSVVSRTSSGPPSRPTAPAWRGIS
jgi:hypothetical protein